MKKYLKTIIITLLIIMVVIVIKDEYENLLMRNSTYGMEALIRRGEIEDLYLGSSLFRQGLDIEVLKERQPDTYILAYNGLQPVSEYWILEYLLRSGVKIHTLYVDMYPFTLTADPSLSDEKMFMELDISDKADLYRSVYEKTEFKDIYRVFVTANNEAVLTWPIYGIVINRFFEDGGTLTETAGMTKEQADASGEPDVIETVNDRQREAVLSMIKTCSDHGIKLIFIETPKYAKLTESSSYKSGLSAYVELLDEYRMQYFRADEVCDESIGDPENYIDLLHLSSKGRKTYSEMLINKVE